MDGVGSELGRKVLESLPDTEGPRDWSLHTHILS